MEWLEEEYQRLVKQGKFDSGLQFNELMNGHEIAIINTGKVIYKMEWLEEEYQRLIKQGKFDSGLQFNELMN